VNADWSINVNYCLAADRCGFFDGDDDDTDILESKLANGHNC